MARTSTLEWWRPAGAQEAAVSGAVARVRGGSLPFWMLMTFTFFMMLAPQDFLVIYGQFRKQ